MGGAHWRVPLINAQGGAGCVARAARARDPDIAISARHGRWNSICGPLHTDSWGCTAAVRPTRISRGDGSWIASRDAEGRRTSTERSRSGPPGSSRGARTEMITGRRRSERSR
jgi:hypothetical protein